MIRRRFFWGIGLTGGAVLACWLVGLFAFVAEVAAYVEPPVADQTPTTDAIVVLTGGSERLQTGLALLKAGKGKKLLISGVYPGVGIEKILAHGDVPDELRNCCISLGHVADNTQGNAAETLLFLQTQDLHSVRLVTAHYHMPRSLFLFRRLMPDIEIVPHPVSPDIVNLNDWWTRWGTASLLIGEYDKYLYARFRALLGIL